MITVWKQYQREMPECALFIEAGLSKLQDYFDLAIQVPAYQLAICMTFVFIKYRLTDKLYYIFSTSSLKEAFLIHTAYA